MSTLVSEQKDQLVKDLRAVMHDAQHLLDSGVASCSAQAGQTRERLETAINDMRQSLAACQPNVRQRLTHWQHASDDYVHQHPWTTMGVAVAAGVTLGWLLGRR